MTVQTKTTIKIEETKLKEQEELENQEDLEGVLQFEEWLNVALGKTYDEFNYLLTPQEQQEIEDRYLTYKQNIINWLRPPKPEIEFHII